MLQYKKLNIYTKQNRKNLLLLYNECFQDKFIELGYHLKRNILTEYSLAKIILLEP